jgi:hypothetical protein
MCLSFVVAAVLSSVLAVSAVPVPDIANSIKVRDMNLGAGNAVGVRRENIIKDVGNNIMVVEGDISKILCKDNKNWSVQCGLTSLLTYNTRGYHSGCFGGVLEVVLPSVSVVKTFPK